MLHGYDVVAHEAKLAAEAKAETEKKAKEEAEKKKEQAQQALQSLLGGLGGGGGGGQGGQQQGGQQQGSPQNSGGGSGGAGNGGAGPGSSGGGNSNATVPKKESVEEQVARSTKKANDGVAGPGKKSCPKDSGRNASGKGITYDANKGVSGKTGKADESGASVISFEARGDGKETEFYSPVQGTIESATLSGSNVCIVVVNAVACESEQCKVTLEIPSDKCDFGGEINHCTKLTAVKSGTVRMKVENGDQLHDNTYTAFGKPDAPKTGPVSQGTR